ncbi:MAG: hypothetical protein ACXQTW_06870 [Candidatus Methanospirareceae archaeon]
MKEFGDEERGEIAVIFDAGIIIGLCREKREGETHEEWLYELHRRLLSAIGREIGRRVAMSADQEMIRAICRKIGMSTEEIESFEKGKLQKLARQTFSNEEMAMLRLHRRGSIESKLKKSVKVGKIWGNRNISQKIRRYFGEEDAKFAKVAVAEWSKHPTLFITTDYCLFRRLRERIPSLNVEHIEKEKVNFKFVMER